MLHPVHLSRLPAFGLGLLALLAALGALWAAWGGQEDYAGVGQYSGTYAQTPDNIAISTELPIETFLPFARQSLTPQQALATNLASPLERANPLPPAFLPNWLAPDQLAQASDCMTKAIYYEAASEPPTGQLAVAQVILNRLRHPRYPKTVCGVVYEGAEKTLACQFSFACDGSTRRVPNPAGLARAHAVAEAALHGAISPVAGQATHYHTTAIVPLWAHELRKVAIVAHHVFYRPPSAYGGWPASVARGVPVAVEAAPAMELTALAHPAPAPTANAGVKIEATPVAMAVPTQGENAGANPSGTTVSGEPAKRSFFPSQRRRNGAYALPSQ